MICEFPQQNDSVVGMEAFIVKHSPLLFHEGDRCTLTSEVPWKLLLLKLMKSSNAKHALTRHDYGSFIPM